MNEITPISQRFPPLLSAVIFLFISMLGFVAIGPVIGGMVALPFFEGNMEEFSGKLMNPYDDPSMKGILFILQGCATGIGLILIPFLYIKYFERRDFGAVFLNSEVKLGGVISIFLIIMSFMVVNSIFIEWNQGLELPESMAGFEAGMRAREDQAMKITKYLTTFDRPSQFLVGIFVIAVLAGVGEELVFRGFLQHEFHAAFRNPHVAIWLSAFLFSAIHMQFFGLVPRMLLGALFGYLYLWSGNLIYPMAAHFVQNASQLVILYFVQKGVTDIDVDDPESFPWYMIILFSLVTFALLYYFRANFRKQPGDHGQLGESI